MNSNGQERRDEIPLLLLRLQLEQDVRATIYQSIDESLHLSIVGLPSRQTAVRSSGNEIVVYRNGENRRFVQEVYCISPNFKT